MYELLSLALGVFFYLAVLAFMLSVALSLARIARNLERVVNRWDLERETGRPEYKPVVVDSDSLV
jgi:hypothetical protein